MKKLKHLIILMVLLAWTAIVQAQDGNTEQGVSIMRSNGRIYVVVAVMLTILIGLFIYLVRLDRKITKLEKQ